MKQLHENIYTIHNSYLYCALSRRNSSSSHALYWRWRLRRHIRCKHAFQFAHIFLSWFHISYIFTRAQMHSTNVGVAMLCTGVEVTFSVFCLLVITIYGIIARLVWALFYYSLYFILARSFSNCYRNKSYLWKAD